MVYKEEMKDLFTVPNTFYLVQCISADFGMGRGIAVEFNRRFNTKENLQRAYSDQGGNYLHIWSSGKPRSTVVKDGRVLNLVTKQRYFQKPTYESFAQSLYDLRALCRTQDICRLAMPRIGCGLDGLDWGRVSDMIKHVFRNDDLEILVCIFPGK